MKLSSCQNQDAVQPNFENIMNPELNLALDDYFTIANYALNISPRRDKKTLNYLLKTPFWTDSQSTEFSKLPLSKSLILEVKEKKERYEAILSESYRNAWSEYEYFLLFGKKKETKLTPTL